MHSHLADTAGRAFGGGPVRHAVAGGLVEAEQLGAHAVILEAGAGAAVPLTLGVQREQLPRKVAVQVVPLVRSVVQAGGRFTAAEWKNECQMLWLGRRKWLWNVVLSLVGGYISASDGLVVRAWFVEKLCRF